MSPQLSSLLVSFNHSNTYYLKTTIVRLNKKDKGYKLAPVSFAFKSIPCKPLLCRNNIYYYCPVIKALFREVIFKRRHAFAFAITISFKLHTFFT